MTTPIDPFERRLPSVFTDLAAARTPDYFIDILGQTARTRQRPAWATPGRWIPMNASLLRAAAAVGAFGLVLVIGGVLLLARPLGSNTGGSTPTPTPSPAVLDPQAQGQSRPAGTYRVAAPFARPFTVQVAAAFVPQAVAADEVRLDIPLAVQLIDRISPDPCHDPAPAGASPAASPTVDDLIAGLGRIKSYAVSQPVDITIDGHAGKSVVLTDQVDAWTGMCSDLQLQLWALAGGGIFEVDDDERIQVRIVDVDGVPVAVVTWDDFAAPANTADASKAADSIAFD